MNSDVKKEAQQDLFDAFVQHVAQQFQTKSGVIANSYNMQTPQPVAPWKSNVINNSGNLKGVLVGGLMTAVGCLGGLGYGLLNRSSSSKETTEVKQEVKLPTKTYDVEISVKDGKVHTETKEVQP